MLEVWINEEDPVLHVILRPASAMPPNLAERDWSFLGLSKV